MYRKWKWKSEMKILGVTSNASLGWEQVQSDSTRGHSQRQKGDARARIKALLVFAVQSICSSASHRQAGPVLCPSLAKKEKFPRKDIKVECLVVVWAMSANKGLAAAEYPLLCVPGRQDWFYTWEKAQSWGKSNWGSRGPQSLCKVHSTPPNPWFWNNHYKSAKRGM